MALFVIKFFIILVVLASIPTWGYRMPYEIPDADDLFLADEAKNDLTDRTLHFSNYRHCMTESQRIDLNVQDSQYIYMPHAFYNTTCVPWSGPIIDPLSLTTIERDLCYAYSNICTTVTENRVFFRRPKFGGDGCWEYKELVVATGCKCAILFTKTTK